VRIDVTDPGDARLDPYRSLRGRPADEDTFVVEGVTTLRQALDAGIELRSALVLPTRVEEVEPLGIPFHVADRAAFEVITGFDVHRGVLAIAERPPEPDLDDLLATSRRVLAIEGVADSANVGSLFRNAAALGADAVVLDPTCCDPLLRRSVRVSVGTVLAVPFARVPDWPAGLTGRGLTLLALTPSGSVDVLDVAPPERFALLVGTEGEGLSADALAAADERVRITMANGVDSVNVATAAAIALHSLSRSSVQSGGAMTGLQRATTPPGSATT
jgi:tRNA G18 (ribose-2'-O)-methylase SpoU